MKIVAVVPIKLNNERLPGKNIKILEKNKPLCSYILETLCDVKYLDEIYVYCSDETIKNYIPKEATYLKRSQNLDTNDTKMNEILVNFAIDIQADIYVMTHATAPFIQAKSIEKGIEAVLNENFDSSFSVEKLHEFLWQDGTPYNYSLDNIPRTQDLPAIYRETSGFYIYKEFIIRNMKQRIGNKPFLVEVNKIEAVDIDTAEDFNFAKQICNK